jgi:hypothetical protein
MFLIIKHREFFREKHKGRDNFWEIRIDFEDNIKTDCNIIGCELDSPGSE